MEALRGQEVDRSHHSLQCVQEVQHCDSFLSGAWTLCKRQPLLMLVRTCPRHDLYLHSTDLRYHFNKQQMFGC